MPVIDQFFKLTFWQQSQYHCYLFTGTQYPLLLLQFWRRYLQAQQLPSTYLELAQFEPAALKATLATPLLGQVQFYWLGDLSILPAKRQSELVQYLAQYQGPHRVIAWLSAATAQGLQLGSTVLLTDLSRWESQSPKQLVGLAQPYFQFHQQPVPQNFLAQLAQLTTPVSLDQYLLLLHYGVVFGERSTQFFATWLPKLVVLEQSLFTLSSHFFAGQATPFFTALAPLAAEYPEQFWTVYWSEQLFRAYYYLYLQQQGDVAGAKRVAYRLPYTFIQQDWRHYTLDELQQAHSFIQQADYELKSGASATLLELFYLQFLNGDFKG